jgi:Cof subfamily protein (haloacid dehalogenase superfamily)
MLDKPDRRGRAKAKEHSASAVVAPPCAMVIFGAAGDLTKRLVVPALYNLANDRQLSGEFRLVGVDLTDISAAQWRAVAPHVAREAWTVKFPPKVVADVREHLQQVAKIVGVSDDLDKVKRCEAEAQAAFGQRATATRSQPYYLDVTNKNANKGAVVEYLSQHVGVPAEEIATIGDQPNDVLMFKRSGFSIAMGNASDEVKAQAAAVTASYNDEGFAKAMEAFILGSTR